MAENLSIDEYSKKFPTHVQTIIEEIRSIIMQANVEIEEFFSYGMPAYKLNGKPLIYYAAYKNHIGLYALPKAYKHFSKDLSKYKQGKGSVQFPLDEPMPYSLIKKIVDWRIEEVKQLQKEVKKKKND